MDPSTRPGEEIRDLASSIAAVMRARNRTVAVAESLTSGNVGLQLGAERGASQWFLGGVIAYGKSVKFSLLGVDPGPVVTARCARQMAEGVAQLTGADFTVALTGVGGPAEEEAQAPGTVFIAVGSPEGVQVEEHHFRGDPPEILQASTLQALRILARETAAGG